MKKKDSQFLDRIPVTGELKPISISPLHTELSLVNRVLH